MADQTVPQQIKWEPETEFKINGTEFSQLHNTLKFIIESPSYKMDLEKARSVIGIGQMFELTSKKLHEAITEGKATVIEGLETNHVMD